MRSQFALITILLFAQLLNKSVAAEIDSITKQQQLINAVDKLNFDQLNKTYRKAEERLTASLTKYLTKFQRSEEKLIKKLRVKDSLAALQKAKGLQA
jgi:hypothetical protein